MRRAVVTSLFATLIVMSGCFGSGSIGEPTALELADDSGWLELYLQPNMLMQPVEAEADVPIGWSLQDWFVGLEPPAWSYAPGEDIVVLEAQANITYVALQTTAHTGARTPLTSWFGTDDTWSDHAFHDAPMTLAAGESVTANWNLHVPTGGLHVAHDDTVDLAVATYFADASVSPTMSVAHGVLRLKIEQGGNEPEWGKPDTQEVMLIGSGCFGVDLDQPGVSATWTTDLPVADWIRVDVQAADGALPDVDFSIYAGGEYVHGSHGPAGTESAVIAPYHQEMWGPGPYALTVYSCHPMAGNVDVFITTG